MHEALRIKYWSSWVLDIDDKLQSKQEEYSRSHVTPFNLMILSQDRDIITLED